MLTQWLEFREGGIASARGGGFLSTTPAETCDIDGCKVVCEGGQQPGGAPRAFLQGVKSRYQIPDFCLVVKSSRHKTCPIGVHMYRGDVGACTVKGYGLGTTLHPTVSAFCRYIHLILHDLGTQGWHAKYMECIPPRNSNNS